MDNYKAVICCVNSKYIHSSLAPWCLFAGIKEYCNSTITPVVVEGTINEKIENIQNRIVAEKPNVVGFCAYIWNIGVVNKLAEFLKATMPNVQIVLGGPEVSYNAENVLNENQNVDYVVSGEGEVAFANLVTAISNKELPQNISGVSYRNKDELVIAEPAILETDPVSPYCEDFFENLKGRIAYLETSRGCPYSCAFCLSGRCGKARFFDIDRAKNDIILLANSGAQTIKLVDRTFNANKARAKELYQFIIDNYKVKIPENVCFHFEIAGDILDDETINILSSAPVGLMQLEIGLQSFNEKTLAYINRKTNTQRLCQNILKLTKNNNMHIHIDLIAGLPYEDLNSFKNSFNTAFSLKSDMLQLGFLKLLYGAPMRENPEQFPCEYKKTAPYEVIKTPWINEDELAQLHRLEDALDRVHNSGRFKRTTEYALCQSGLTPFDFFDGFANYIKNKKIEKIPLDMYTQLLFEYIKTLKNIDKVVLRDKMVCDRICTNASGKLPQALQIKDENFRVYKIALKENPKYKQPDKVVRGIAILYSQQSVAYVDYVDKNNSTGEYPLNIVPISELEADKN